LQTAYPPPYRTDQTVSHSSWRLGRNTISAD